MLDFRFQLNPPAHEIVACSTLLNGAAAQYRVDAYRTTLAVKAVQRGAALYITRVASACRAVMPEGNLFGWRVAAGNWTQTPDGELRSVSDPAGVMLECETEFGTHWQFSGEVVHGNRPYNPWDAGILLNVDGRPHFSMMFIRPKNGWPPVLTDNYKSISSRSNHKARQHDL
jgi:hypothetical protein